MPTAMHLLKNRVRRYMLAVTTHEEDVVACCLFVCLLFVWFRLIVFVETYDAIRLLPGDEIHLAAAALKASVATETVNPAGNKE